MSTNFLIFDENAVNMMSDVDYQNDSQRENGVVPGVAPASLHNKLYYQTSIMAAAFGQYMSNRGFTVSDSNFNALVSVIAACFAGIPGAGWGCQLSNNSTDANNDIDITAGVWLDSTGAVTMSGGAMTKRLDAAWASGTNQGGIFSGSKQNNTAYHVFMIADASGAVDYGFSTSITASDKPVLYPYYRRLGTIFTDGSGNIRGFRQIGDYFLFKAAVENTTSLSTSATNIAITVPPDVEVLADVSMGSSMTSGTSLAIEFRASHPDDTPQSRARCGVNGITGSSFYATLKGIPTNTSQQIRYQAVLTGGTPASQFLNTIGYLDNRGKVY